MKRIITIIAAIALAIIGLCVIINAIIGLGGIISGATSGSGTESDPYTELTMNASDVWELSEDIWIYSGSTVTITGNSVGDWDYVPNHVESGHGLTLTGYTISGNITSAGQTCSMILDSAYMPTGDVDSKQFTFHIVGTVSTATVSFVASPTAGGTFVSSQQTITQITVPVGTTYRYISAQIPYVLGFSYGGTSLYSVAATANTGYTFSNWSSESGTITGDMTLTANFTGSASTYSYILSYDMKGGSGGPTTQTYTGTLSTWTFAIPSDAPWRTDYIFMGWDTSSSATTVRYNPGDNITLTGTAGGTTSQTLYAVWQYSPVVTYNYHIYYSANGGSPDPATQSSGSTTSTSWTFTITSEIPARTNYTFLGWSTNSSATSATYHGGDSVTLTSSSTTMTLYAVWQQAANYNYRLSFSLGGGSGGPSTQTYGPTIDTSHTFIIPDTIPTYSGYTFLGWDSSSTASTVRYDPGDSITLTGTAGGTASRILYAVWQQISYHTVTLISNPTGAGHFTKIQDGSSTTVTSVSVPDGAYIAIQQYAYNLIVTKDGQTLFSIEATANSGYQFSGFTGVPITVTGDITITANFTAGPSYTYFITYTGEGSGYPSQQTYGPTTDTSHTFTLSSMIPVYEGHTFVEWVNEATDTRYQPGDSVTLNASTTGVSMILTAYFRVSTYTVTFQAGTGGGVSQSSIANVPYGSIITVNGNTVTINGTTVTATADTGYTFSSWSNASGAITAARTITANFTQDVYHTVTLVSNPAGAGHFTKIEGGTSTVVTSVTVPDGAWIGVQQYASNLSVYKDGQLLFRITAEEDGEYTFNGFVGAEVTVTSDITITANYYKAISITFETYPTDVGTIDPITCQTGDYVTWWAQGNALRFGGSVAVNVYGPSVIGYEFVKWQINGEDMTKQTMYTLNDDTVFTCVYQWTVHTVTFAVDGGGTVSPATIADIPHNSPVTVDGDTVTINGTTVTAIPDTGWIFSSWSGTGESITYDKTITAHFIQTATIEFVSNPAGAGSFMWEQETITQIIVPVGTVMSIDDSTNNVTFIYDGTILYTIKPIANKSYMFDGWDATSGTITGDMTLEAYFVKAPAVPVHWSNDEYNGSVSILYHMDSKSEVYDINGSARLFKFDDTATEKFVPTDYYVTFNVHSERGTSSVSAAITLNGEIIRSNEKTLGQWMNVIVVMDASEHVLKITLANQFKSFIDYGTRETSTILDYSDILETDSLTVYNIDFFTLDKAPRQQVVKTTVFLNTYGVVMIDPVFDVNDYWPGKTNIRMNFFSFALYGDNVTFNGHTMDVEKGQLIVKYVIVNDKNELYVREYDETTDKGIVHHIVTANGDYTKDYKTVEKRFGLTNIYLTWQDGHCYLTFASDNNWTVDLGPYNNRIISMQGIWYFHSGVYDYHVEHVKEIVKDWSIMSFNFTIFVIIALGLLVLTGVVLRVKTDAKIGDYLIIIGAIAILMIMLGGLAK